jgi:hypothetical protein
MIDFLDVYDEITDSFENLKEKIKVFKEATKGVSVRQAEDVKKYLDESIDLVSDIGVSIFDMRSFSFELFRQSKVRGNSNAFYKELNIVRYEIRDNIYALVQINNSMIEVIRILRGFLAY